MIVHVLFNLDLAKEYENSNKLISAILLFLERILGLLIYCVCVEQDKYISLTAEINQYLCKI